MENIVLVIVVAGYNSDFHYLIVGDPQGTRHWIYRD